MFLFHLEFENSFSRNNHLRALQYFRYVSLRMHSYFERFKRVFRVGCLFFLNNRRLMFEKHLFKGYSKVFSIFLATFNVLIDDFSFSLRYRYFLRERKKQLVALSFAVQLITSFRYYLSVKVTNVNGSLPTCQEMILLIPSIY